MTNLRTDEIVFFRNLTKIGTDENKAIYSNSFIEILILIFLTALVITFFVISLFQLLLSIIQNSNITNLHSDMTNSIIIITIKM